jgi:hypothetical protein
MQLQTTVITGMSWDDVQVGMRHDLAGCFAFSKKIADSLHAHTAPVQSRPDLPAQLEHLPCLLRFDAAEILLMVVGYHEHVAWYDWKQVHERGNGLVPVHEARFALSLENLAEYTISLEAHPERIARNLYPGQPT